MNEHPPLPKDAKEIGILRNKAIGLMLDELSEGFVKAFHLFGRRGMAQINMVPIDCVDCGALLSFNIICPVDDFMHNLKDTLGLKGFKKTLEQKIKEGREFNERKGFKVRGLTKDEPKGHHIDID